MGVWLGFCFCFRKAERQPHVWNLKLFFSEATAFAKLNFLSTLDPLWGFNFFKWMKVERCFIVVSIEIQIGINFIVISTKNILRLFYNRINYSSFFITHNSSQSLTLFTLDYLLLRFWISSEKHRYTQYRGGEEQ